MDLYNHSPIRLHGVMLNLLSTGTTLPLSLPFYRKWHGKQEYLPKIDSGRFFKPVIQSETHRVPNPQPSAL
jgi:hypothetical protein